MASGLSPTTAAVIGLVIIILLPSCPTYLRVFLTITPKCRANVSASIGWEGEH